ncbi:5-oxoprolinase subunit C family protein [Diaphorobacter caeni]|uniref:5-oxoprolinase subunit C family protein n=1 Tax=Diaphorobacter caeni TaxID=2784387 RepID=UPI00188E0753|nr:biotin-dependent carboxyltransferase family protein [Diaphorobacter caeni]MBF5007208.1 biotin-dependent carboxyltransferase family protein [Diaphorobacter caeni]
MIEILATGGLTTVQDAGRRGYRRYGVGVGGPLDALAAQVGNLMVGNAVDAAFLEVVIFPLRLRFQQATRIAVTGSDAQMEVDGQRCPPWWSVVVQPGQSVTLRAPERGGVAYVCVAGGIDVPLVLGSRSTDLKAGFGGLDGRTLRKGDVLQVATGRPSGSKRRYGVLPPCAGIPAPQAADAQTDAQTGAATVVRVLPAAQWENFGEAIRTRFLSQVWQITPESNRIGMRLNGDEGLQPERRVELLSHGIVPGVVQIPPHGQPIVMQCDAQTAGGYPKIATVIEADMWRLAQTPIGGHLRFQSVSLSEALSAQQDVQNYLAGVRRAVELLFQDM